MKKIEIYEEALCCSTGVCGPSVDDNLLRITNLSQAINESEDCRVIRRNLAQNPNAFTAKRQPLVFEKISEEGINVLPITIVDGEIVEQGTYPSTEILESITGHSLTK